jgi:hypothetical protein
MKIMLPSSLRVKNEVSPAVVTMILPVQRAAMLSPVAKPWLVNGPAAVSGQFSSVTPPVVVGAETAGTTETGNFALNAARVAKSGLMLVMLVSVAA